MHKVISYVCAHGHAATVRDGAVWGLALWANGQTGERGETWERIGTTIADARRWLGY